MIDTKSFSEEQKAKIQMWADEGVGLSGIQRQLDDQMGIKATYMETRFLIDDLAIKMPEDEKPEPEEEAADEAVEFPEAVESGGEAVEPEKPAEKPDPSESSSVSVTISEIQRPGAMVSGAVTFAGGESADWWMDEFGQLGMDPKNSEFKPSEADVKSFQKELQKVAKRKGI